MALCGHAHNVYWGVYIVDGVVIGFVSLIVVPGLFVILSDYLVNGKLNYAQYKILIYALLSVCIL